MRARVCAQKGSCERHAMGRLQSWGAQQSQLHAVAFSRSAWYAFLSSSHRVIGTSTKWEMVSGTEKYLCGFFYIIASFVQQKDRSKVLVERPACSRKKSACGARPLHVLALLVVLCYKPFVCPWLWFQPCWPWISFFCLFCFSRCVGSSSWSMFQVRCVYS
jgi:hypothetical protein